MQSKVERKVKCGSEENMRMEHSSIFKIKDISSYLNNEKYHKLLVPLEFDALIKYHVSYLEHINDRNVFNSNFI